MSRLRSSTLQVLVAVAATATLATLVHAHVDGLNGPSYWQWPWQRIDLARLWPPFVLALLPFGAAQWLRERRPAGVVLPLALLMLSSLLLQLAVQGVQVEPFSLAPMALVVESPRASGYLQAASRLLEVPEPLRHYPLLLSSVPQHAQTKPPGIALTFAAFARIFGTGPPAAMAIALFLAVAATVVVPATHAAVRLLCGRDVAFPAASLVALLPATAVFSPSFDAVYPVLTCAWVGTWYRALAPGGTRWAIAFGALVAAGLFYSYSPVVLGVFLGVVTLWWAAPQWRVRLVRASRRAGVALLVLVSAYAMLFTATGFDPLATFAAAVRIQEQWLQVIPRPYPETAVFDLSDFLMGAAWLPIVPAVACLWLGLRAGDRDRVWLVGGAFLQLLVVAVSALLPGETMRVWLFLQPLLVTAAALEMARWSVAERLVFYACVAILYAAIVQNMIFVVA